MTHIQKMIAAREFDKGVMAKQLGLPEEELDAVAEGKESLPPNLVNPLASLLRVSEAYLTTGYPDPKSKDDRNMGELIATYEAKSKRLEGKSALEALLKENGKELSEAILNCFYDGWKPYPYDFDSVLATVLLKLDDYSLFALLSDHYPYRKEGSRVPSSKQDAIDLIATDGKVLHKDLDFYRVSGIRNIATGDEYLAKTKSGDLPWDDALILEAIGVGGRIKSSSSILSGPSYDVFETRLVEEHCRRNLEKNKQEKR